LSTFTFQPLYGQNSLQPAHNAGLTEGQVGRLVHGGSQELAMAPVVS
jgi:hypothetical protein